MRVCVRACVGLDVRMCVCVRMSVCECIGDMDACVLGSLGRYDGIPGYLQILTV